MSEAEGRLLPYLVRPMRLGDVDQVAAIERLCFPLPWPPETYRRDLRYNGNSHYLVAERRRSPPEVVGFGGYWLISDEVHISTLGVHPDHRRLGLGEYLLAGILLEALARGAYLATLEVRVSNAAAQALYCKYGLRVVRRRRRYYRDNNEDAFVMSVESLRSESYQELLARRWDQLMARFLPPSLEVAAAEEVLSRLLCKA